MVTMATNNLFDRPTDCGVKTNRAHKHGLEVALTTGLRAMLPNRQAKECGCCGLPFVGTTAYCESCLSEAVAAE